MSRSARLPRYNDDAEYLRDEIRWIRQRCLMVLAKRRLAHFVTEFPVTHEARERESVRLTLFAWQKRVRDAHDSVRNWRAEIDHRLATGRMAHKTVSLDRTVSDFGLTEEDRTILLLAAAPLLQRGLEPLYDELANRELLGGLTPEVVFAFIGAFDEDRIRLRTRFSHDSALVRNDLIRVSPDAAVSPTSLLDARLTLTDTGLTRVLTPAHA